MSGYIPTKRTDIVKRQNGVRWRRTVLTAHHGGEFLLKYLEREGFDLTRPYSTRPGKEFTNTMIYSQAIE